MDVVGDRDRLLQIASIARVVVCRDPGRRPPGRVIDGAADEVALDRVRAARARREGATVLLEGAGDHPVVVVPPGALGDIDQRGERDSRVPPTPVPPALVGVVRRHERVGRRTYPGRRGPHPGRATTLLVGGLPSAGTDRTAVQQAARVPGGEHDGPGRSGPGRHTRTAEGRALGVAGALVPRAVEPDLVARGAVFDDAPGHAVLLVEVQADGAAEESRRRYGGVVTGRRGGVGPVAGRTVAHCWVDPVGAGDGGGVAAGADPAAPVPHRVGDVEHQCAGAGPGAGDARPAEQGLPGGAPVPGPVQPDRVAGHAIVDAGPRHVVGVGDVQPQDPAVDVPVRDREGVLLRPRGVQRVARQRADRRRGAGGRGQGDQAYHG